MIPSPARRCCPPTCSLRRRASSRRPPPLDAGEEGLLSGNFLLRPRRTGRSPSAMWRTPRCNIGGGGFIAAAVVVGSNTFICLFVSSTMLPLWYPSGRRYYCPVGRSAAGPRRQPPHTRPPRHHASILCRPPTAAPSNSLRSKLPSRRQDAPP